jgi:two-component system, chemotaxis family, sensor kinase Cph1
MNFDWKTNLHTLDQSTHACLIFKNRDEQMSATIPFLQIGLEQNERCLYLADPITLEFVKDNLKLVGIDLEKEIARGALQLMSKRDYLHLGQFDRTKMIESLLASIEESLSLGFSGFRATGDVLWELGTNVDVRKLLKYEMELDHALQGKPVVALCQYREDSFPTRYIRNAIYTHGTVLLNKRKCSYNPYFDSSKPFEELDLHHRHKTLELFYSSLGS